MDPLLLPVRPDSKRPTEAQAPMPGGDLHLRFELGGRDQPGSVYAFPAVGVVEVVDLSVARVTALPNTSPALIGTFNLRGEIIWVLDSEYVLHGTLFNPSTAAFPVIVIQDGEHLLGLAVRSIQGMVWINAEQIEAPRGEVPPTLARFVRGSEGQLLILDSTAILRSRCWDEKPAFQRA